MRILRKKDTRIPRRPLLWLAAALLFTLPPMLGTLAAWVPGLFLIALVSKFWMEPKGYRLRSATGKVILAALILAAIFISYGSVKGIEPGVSLIVMLMSIKILEAHTDSEFQVMVMVAFVLCLCGFFFSQDLAISLCLLVAFTLLLAALVQFHCGSSCAFWPPARTASKLLAQAAPLMAVLFLLFPRVTTGFRLQIAQSRGAAAGFSGQLSPGSVTALANSSEVAFRAEFPDGKIPPPSALYWRGVVMWQGEGLEWKAPIAPASIPQNAQRHAGAEAIRQWITIEPHDARWMFALDWPGAAPSGATLAPGNYLWSGQPIRKPRRYEVASLPKIPEKKLPPRERKLLLDVPDTIGPRARALAQSWAAGNAPPRAIVNKGLRFFRSEGFRYSLSPGEYNKNDIDEFLFHRRLGFCEHYAAGFATLMRLAGIPARVVTGYLGADYNGIGHFFLVRQAHAHAWCEVWLPETGWERIDPTSVVAPDRINLGLNSFLERQAVAAQAQDRHGGFMRKLTRWPIFTRARLTWQTINYEWETHVLSFDSDAQESLFASIGFANRGPISLLGTATLVVIGLLTIYTAWIRLRSRPGRNRIKMLYQDFCRKAARLGAVREPSEGPLHFSSRARLLLPNESERIVKLSNAYIALRYSAEADPLMVELFAKEVRAFGRAF